mgnify:FL=1
MANNRTLITGGAGFIGSHLVDALLARGERVTVVDDLSTGRRENLQAHSNQPDLSLIEGSVCDRQLVDDLVADCDRVFHLAAGVGVRKLAEGPAELLEENAIGTAVLLGSCVRHRRPVLIASSSEVYGKSYELPQREGGDITLGPPQETRWSYACSKAVGEYLALAHHRSDGLPVVVARLFNTVGPRQRGRYGMVIPRFIQQAEAGAPITVYGDGSQTRCFCHVRDTVAALIALLETPDAAGQVVNVGSAERVTIEALATRIREMTGSASEVATQPFESAYGPDMEDMRDRQPDLSRLFELTGSRPGTSLDEILQDSIDHFRQFGDPDAAG